MAQSQLEVLANALNRPDNPSESKVESMALYLPQENVNTGQLEFTPVVLYPDPKSERVFISYDAESGKAPTLPKALTKLPGFSHAATLLPGYPMISSSAEFDPDVGTVEEVMCDPRFKYAPPALSVPLLSGPQTVGVLLVSARAEPTKEQFWSENDRRQVSSAAQSLSMALTMDNERSILRERNQVFKDSLSDSLHQVKNPLQALRTYGKILQRHMVDADPNSADIRSPQLLELVERLMTQSDRVVDLMIPMDTIVDSLEPPGPYILKPAEKESQPQPLVLWEEKPKNEAVVSEPSNQIFEFGGNNAERMGSVSTPRTLNATTATSDDSMTQESVQVKAKTVQTNKAHTVGDVETEMVFVNDILEPIFSAFDAIASERNIHLEVVEMDAELPGVIAAPKSLQEAVSNLLDNAIKYVMLPKSNSIFLSNPTPKVRVRIFANHDPVGVTILVEDNGPGISPADAEQIFDRGFRGAATQSVEGTGIGLDISHALVRRMGGDLKLANHKEYPECLDGTVMALTLYRTIP